MHTTNELAIWSVQRIAHGKSGYRKLILGGLLQLKRRGRYEGRRPGRLFGKLVCLEGLGNRFKIHDHANRDSRRGAEVKLSAPTAYPDHRTANYACGASDVAGPAKAYISTFSSDR